jgi:hypothetical protein
MATTNRHRRIMKEVGHMVKFTEQVLRMRVPPAILIQATS